MEIVTESWDDGDLIVNQKYAELLKHNSILTAEALWKMYSEPVKNVLKERTSERVFLEPVQGTEYPEAFLKRYSDVPIKERMKSLVSFKKTIFDAYDEWESILEFHRYNLCTMDPIAVGRYKGNTCNLTLGIQNYQRASEIFMNFKPEDYQLKRDIIGGIASLAGRMHAANMSHQDFYLVHLFITGENYENIYIIDLQRVIKQNNLMLRWKIKDLAQIYFSARNYVSNADILFFWKVYTNIADKSAYRNKKLISTILRKAARIKRHDAKRRQRKAEKEQQQAK